MTKDLAFTKLFFAISISVILLCAGAFKLALFNISFLALWEIGTWTLSEMD